MPGMGHPLQTNNAFILSAFHRSLFHQLLFVLLIALVVLVAWNTLRTVQYGGLWRQGARCLRHRVPVSRASCAAAAPDQLRLIWLFDASSRPSIDALGLPQGS